MRPNRAGSALSQYFCSLLTAVLLLVSLLCGLIFFATTRTFAASVLSSSEKESQHKTEWNAAQIQADFALSDAALAPLSGACAAYQAELAVYWHDFFRTDAEELPAAPAPLDEREMVALVMADEGFQARVDADFRRATARDEVVYPLSQFVQRYSFPIRQSLMELLGGLAAQKCSLPRLLHAVEISGAVCLLAATLLIGACTPAMEIYRGICHIAKEGTFCLENEEPYTLADRPVSLNFETQNCENKLFFTYFAK